MIRVYLLSLILPFSFFVNAQNNKVRKEATPSWVTVPEHQYNNNMDADAEDGYVDLDYELQVSLAQQSKYTKKEMKILSEAGVQNNSEISVNFDPTYQQLIFHCIKIHRANQTIDKLELSKFKVIQQEKDLEKHLYDGSLSEYKSWKEVNDWAKNLFPFNLQLSSALQTKISEIKNNYTTNEDRTLAALRFVQDEVRYMGIEIGTGSHKPNHPNKIMDQRFGDCKDKSYLLCTVLRAMDIEANPVLINTEYKKTILEWLPSPSLFDHCTVMAKVNDAVYWFDPTIAYQRGKLKDISYPDYQCGLVISENSQNLTSIPLQVKGKINIKEVFNVPDMSGSANLMVKTIYTGYFADNAREDFKNNSLYEMQKSYRSYFTSYFDNITADSITYSDDDMSGVFTTIEYYQIHDFWKMEKGIKKASLSPFTINAVLSKPEQASRTMPFKLSFPSRYKEEIEVNLPEDWNAESSSDDIKCSSFLLNYKFSSSNKQIHLVYEYENLKDHVEVGELNEYLANYKKIDENVGYGLTYSNGTASFIKKDRALFSGSGSPFPLFYTILGLCLFITIVIRRNRRQNNY